MSIDQWSTTAANNATGVTNVNWAEGQAPSTVNDSARNMMADIASWRDTLFTTGDVKLTLKTVADSGWVLMNDGTIGDASSGATRANADTSALFTLLWTNTTNADCAVSTGRGASAALDFAAHKTMALPKTLGRALAVYGSGSGLTARTLGSKLGHEQLHQHTHSVTDPNHSHGVSDPGHVHSGQTKNDSVNTNETGRIANGGAGADLAGWNTGSNTTGLTVSSGSTGISIVNAGTGDAQNMQPTVFLNVMIKL